MDLQGGSLTGRREFKGQRLHRLALSSRSRVANEIKLLASWGRLIRVNEEKRDVERQSGPSLALKSMEVRLTSGLRSSRGEGGEDDVEAVSPTVKNLQPAGSRTYLLLSTLAATAAPILTA